VLGGEGGRDGGGGGAFPPSYHPYFLFTISAPYPHPLTQAIREELEEREEGEKRRSSSKKKRQGHTKVKSGKEGGARVEARLDAKRFRRTDRRLVNQQLGPLVPEEDEY
jgi:hypothetical protein